MSCQTSRLTAVVRRVAVCGMMWSLERDCLKPTPSEGVNHVIKRRVRPWAGFGCTRNILAGAGAAINVPPKQQLGLDRANLQTGKSLLASTALGCPARVNRQANALTAMRPIAPEAHAMACISPGIGEFYRRVGSTLPRDMLSRRVAPVALSRFGGTSTRLNGRSMPTTADGHGPL